MINFYYYNHHGLDEHGKYALELHRWLTGYHQFPYPNIMHIIKRSPSQSHRYAREVLKSRWIEMEPVIITSPIASYNYAFKVIGDRWLNAEPVIMKSPAAAYCYARDVMKCRWIEAESYIKPSEFWWKEYCEVFDV